MSQFLFMVSVIIAQLDFALVSGCRDYPSFYTRLYAFLDRDVLHLKHRARFFRMTELFLSSTFVVPGCFVML